MRNKLTKSTLLLIVEVVITTFFYTISKKYQINDYLSWFENPIISFFIVSIAGLSFLWFIDITSRKNKNLCNILFFLLILIQISLLIFPYTRGLHTLSN